MLDVVIIDDEPVAVRRLATLLKSCEGVRVAGSATNADEARRVVMRTLPQVVFLDIEMPGVDGMELAGGFRALNDAPIIVFVTAFARFAVEAFGIGASDYLLKPVELERLRDTVKRVQSTIAQKTMASRVFELEHIVKRLRAQGESAQEPSLWLESQRGRIRVKYSDILWLAAERDYVHVHLTERSFFIRGRLMAYESELIDHGFVRVHRSFIVQKSHIISIDLCGDRQHTITMSNGAKVRISRQFAHLARELTKSAQGKL